MFDATVMLVSRDRSLGESVAEALKIVENCRMELCRGFAEAASILPRSDVLVGLVHVANADDEVLVPELFWEAALDHKAMSLVALSDHYCPELGLEYLRLGVKDYFSRPLDLRRLVHLIDELTVQTRCTGLLRTSHSPPSSSYQRSWETERLQTESQALRQMMLQIQTAAQGSTTILLGGETGTGKTRLARLLHEMSPRRNRPFMAINCGSLAPNLMESEMFGHMKGSFTGADRTHSGKFTDVADGTLFLDEIDTLDPVLQAKLLRVVENREYEPVGSNKTLPMRARLIVASNCDLEGEVAAQRFRKDLFFRLNVVDFKLPPLRDRRGDIPALAQKFLDQFLSQHEFTVSTTRPALRMGSEVLAALQAYDWPGNIRELRNVVERVVLLCTGPIVQLKDLPEKFQGLASRAPRGNSSAFLADTSLAEARSATELMRVTEVLQRNDNNVTKAAQALGISRAAFYKKLHKLGLLSD